MYWWKGKGRAQAFHLEVYNIMKNLALCLSSVHLHILVFPHDFIKMIVTDVGLTSLYMKSFQD